MLTGDKLLSTCIPTTQLPQNCLMEVATKEEAIIPIIDWLL